MRRPQRPWFLALAVLAVGSLLLAGCPARRSGSPVDLESAFLDRA